MSRFSLKHKASTLYKRLFVRAALYRWHYALFRIGLHGIGLQNLDDQYDVSGERNFLKKYLLSAGESPMVFDVGANEGQYLSAIKSFSRDARVHLFEPHPVAFDRLKKNASGLNHVELNNAGCGASVGTLTLFDYPDGGSQHATFHSGVFENIHNSSPASTAVEMTTLDSYCHKKGIFEIDLLKIDTEGHEHAVLLGAKRLLSERRIRAIHFEFNEMNLYSRVFFKDFVELLADFQFHRMLPDGLVPLGPYRADLFELFSYQNIVALRQAA